ncbi:MAG: hypothetical protein ABIM99_05305 [Candidatus Dojkabacteria bacterium]
MKPIIQFLRNQIEPFSKGSEKVDATETDSDNLKSLFINRSKYVTQARHLKIHPRIQKNQIWTVKSEYDDFQGISQKTCHPFLVLINSEQEAIEDENFTRVFIVSPFIELATQRDEVCNDPSIIGFSFLIETWNDQPILTELLNEYVGYYESKSNSFSKTEVFELANEPNSEYSKSNIEILSEDQKEFRNIEISRAKYINHSVLSLLSFLENRQSQDAGVVISLFDKIEYPKFFIGQTQKEPTLSLAAKSGVESEDKYLLYESENIPYQMFFRKNEDGFILSVHTSYKVKLLSNKNEEINYTSNKDKSVFANLKAGIYTLISEQVKEPIKIRLK